MKPTRSIILAGVFILAASGGLLLLLVGGGVPQNDAEDVEPLEAAATPAQRVIEAGLSTSLAPAETFRDFGQMEGDRSFHADIAFYEVVLSYGPISDPRPILLLTNSYIVANQQEYGISFLERLLRRHQNRMEDETQAVYLSAYALLRATYAERVPVPGRIFWVWDTFDVLDEAKALAPNHPLVHWSSGLIYAQVPGFFGKRDAALSELLWLVERPELEPNPGFYRDVYRFLSKLYADEGETELAARYLTKSGYEDYEPTTLSMGWFATTRDEGLLFAPTPWIEEIVPERVFAVRGFGFSDLHFVVSDDGRELISIDAGHQPYSMEAGHSFLMDRYPDLPLLTTAFITHAHWDHIGGSSYLKSLDSGVTLYGRDNYAVTVNRVLRNHTYHQIRGAGFNDEWVSEYQPDLTIAELSEVAIGGTVFELIPVTGGETEDALLIHVPTLGTLFMGDALMPFYGEPWVEEGSIDDAMDTMDEALRRQPEHILHGHVGITAIYGTMEQLEAYRGAHEWLVDEARRHLNNGYSAKDIIRLNLIPPGFQNHPQAFFGYLAARDQVIARAADNMVGIWREDVTGKEPGGLDVITSIEYGRLLDLYIGLSAGQVERALRRMLDGGDVELALQMAIAAEARYSNNAAITLLKEEAGDRLRSSVQFFDPFKFAVYTELIGKEHRSIPAERVR
ncbi:MAG: MBL fold metallo-hydrolase [Nitrospirae bacterium]|nr:MBL fold metallo-hydrolase [Nitrospirota bacterium]